MPSLAGLPEIGRKFNFPSRANLPQQFGSLFARHTVQVRNLMELEPGCISFDPSADRSAARRADVLDRRHCVRSHDRMTSSLMRAQGRSDSSTLTEHA
jgi:hypothetical protein